MKSAALKLAMIGISYGMFDTYHPSKPKLSKTHIDASSYIDKVINNLVSKGVCKISDDVFHIVREKLPLKLRGQVLFHSDIETKQIFVTYKKYKL